MNSSHSLGVIEITDYNREAIRAAILDRYEDPGCGICGRLGGNVFWPNPISHRAHDACYQKIKAIESDLVTTIALTFEKSHHRDQAHIATIRAIKKQLGSVSINTFLATHGSEKLREIFNSVIPSLLDSKL